MITTARRTPLAFHHRLIALLILFAPPLVLLGAAGRAVVAHLDVLLAQTAPLAAAEASRSLGREVRIGGLTPDLSVSGILQMALNRSRLGTIPVMGSDIAISQDRLLNRREALATAKRARILVSLPRLLSGDFSSAFPLIELESPELLLIRRPNGRFNVQDLIKPPARPRRQPFRTEVVVREGRLHFRDYAARFPSARLPADNYFAGVDVRIDMRGTRTIRFESTGRPAPGTPTARRLGETFGISGSLARVSVGGPAAAGTGARAVVRVRAEDAAVAYWFDYASDLPGARVTAGTSDVNVSLVLPQVVGKRTPPPPLQYAGTATLHGISLRHPQVPTPLENLSGNVQFNPNTLRGAVSGFAFRSPVSASGIIWDWQTPQRQVALEVSALRLSVNRALSAVLARTPRTQHLPAGLRLGDTVSLAGYIQGSLTDPVVTGSVRLPVATYRQHRINDIAANLTYADGVLDVSQATAHFAEGTLSGKVTARIAAPADASGAAIRMLPTQRMEAGFSVSASGINLNKIQPLLQNGEPITGRGTVAVVGKVTAGKLSAAANLSAQNVVTRGLQIRDARARVLVTDNRLVIPALSFTSSAGAARIGGQVMPNGRLDLTVRAAGVDAGKIARALGRKDLRGIAYVSGTVRGTVREPLVSASFRVLEPAYQQYRADLVRGDLTATRTRLTLGPNVIVRRASLSALVSGTVAVQKGAAAPRLDLVARLEPLARGREAQVGIAEVLQLLSPDTPTPDDIEGVLYQAAVRVTGTAANSRVNLSGRFRSVVLSGIEVDQGDFSARYADRVAALQARVTRVEGQAVNTALAASARVDARGNLAGSFTSDNLRLDLLEPLTRRYAAVEGSISLAGSIGGTSARPVVTATITGNGPVRVAEIPLSDARATVRYNAANAGIRLSGLSFRQNGTTVRVSEAFWNRRTGLAGATLALDTANIATLIQTLTRSGLQDTPGGARLVTALRRLPTTLAGDLEIERLRVSGRVTPQGFAERNVRLALSAKSFTIGPVPGNAVSADIALRNDLLTVNTFVVTNAAQETRITATGSADVGELLETGGAPGQIVQPLTLEWNNASLALLRTFVRDVPTDVNGRADITIVARGRTRAPTVTASLFGRDVTVAGKPLSLVSVPAVVLSPVAGRTIEGLPAGQIRFTDRVLLRRGDNQIELSGSLPFAYANFRIPATEPINLTADVPQQDVDLIFDLLSVSAPELTREAVGGTIAAQVNVGGTLQNRNLSGFVRIAEGRFRLPRKEGEGRDRINPVDRLDVDLQLDGSTVSVQQFVLALGAPSGQRGNFGRLTLSGDVNLATLEVARRTPARPSGPILTGGVLDLIATFDNFRPVTENLLGRGDVMRGRVNGIVRITGGLGRPRLATPAGQPLRVADAFFQPPSGQASGGGRAIALPVDPIFDLAAVTEDEAVVNAPVRYRVEAEGSGALRGTLAAPNLTASLRVQRGYLQLPTTRFTLQRGGEIALAYRPPQDTRLTVSDLAARANVYVPSGIAPSLDIRAREGGVLASAAPRTTTRSTRYRITVEFDGSLLLDPTTGEFDPQDLNRKVTSDPPLTEAQIVALLGSEQQIRAAVAGNVERALSQTFTQVFSSSLVPSLLSPVEQSVASALGLEEFGLDYNPDAPLTLRFLKRFSNPFERFLAEYTRTIGTRSQPGVPQPYDARLYYELTPRLQLGGSTNEQRDFTLFLRGSFSF